MNLLSRKVDVIFEEKRVLKKVHLQLDSIFLEYWLPSDHSFCPKEVLSFYEHSYKFQIEAKVSFFLHNLKIMFLDVKLFQKILCCNN